MTLRKAQKIINKVMNEGPTEAGVFISLLTKTYLDEVDVTEQEFFKSLKKSIKILNEE